MIIEEEARKFEAAFPGYSAMVTDSQASLRTGKAIFKPSNMFRVWLYLRSQALLQQERDQ